MALLHVYSTDWNPDHASSHYSRLISRKIHLQTAILVLAASDSNADIFESCWPRDSACAPWDIEAPVSWWLMDTRKHWAVCHLEVLQNPHDFLCSLAFSRRQGDYFETMAPTLGMPKTDACNFKEPITVPAQLETRLKKGFSKLDDRRDGRWWWCNLFLSPGQRRCNVLRKPFRWNIFQGSRAAPIQSRLGAPALVPDRVSRL